ncbi:MAG: MBL fold metallo-hydrolase [Mycobacteriales bacterium]
MISRHDIRRLWLGHYRQPEAARHGGMMIPSTGFAIPHGDGLALFDTGFGEVPDRVNAELPTTSLPLAGALAAHGLALADVRYVMNCHLHLDHAGGNPQLPDRPIFAQRTEYDSVSEPDYHLPVRDFPDARYELVDGRAEVLPGVELVPTPGHTPGHQSAVVRCREGRVVLAGQAYGAASDFATAAYNHTVGGAAVPGWVPDLLELEPVAVYFAHDTAVWQPDVTGPEVPSAGSFR